MSKKSRLGRSLDILLSQTKTSNNPDINLKQGSDNSNSNLSSSNTTNQILMLPIEKLSSSQFQPRKFFDEAALLELSESIKSHGILQPIVVRKFDQTDAYEIVAGERRWRSAQLANIHEVPVIIKTISDREALAIAIIENIQREDLNAIEEAVALSRLITEFELTHQETGELIGKSRSAITNLLRLLELTTPIQEMLSLKKIEMGHARALIPLPPLLQLEIGNLIILRGLSVRETENLIKQKKISTQQVTQTLQNPNITSLEITLSQILGSKVQFKHKQNGEGQIMIKYHSLDELDGIINKIK